MKIQANEIENSRQRQADRGRPFGFEAFEPDPQNRPFLGDRAVVEGLVRSFAGDIVEHRKQFNLDKTEGTVIVKAIEGLTERYGKIFMGQDAAYRAQPWNSAEQLGVALNKRMGLDPEPPEKAATALFWRLSADLLDAISDHEGDQIDDETAQFRLDVLIEETTLALLGLPAESTDP